MEDFFQRPAFVFLSEIFKCKVLQQIQFYLRLFLKNIIIDYLVFLCYISTTNI